MLIGSQEKKEIITIFSLICFYSISNIYLFFSFQSSRVTPSSNGTSVSRPSSRSSTSTSSTTSSCRSTPSSTYSTGGTSSTSSTPSSGLGGSSGTVGSTATSTTTSTSKSTTTTSPTTSTDIHPEVYCKVCGVSFNSTKQAQQHYQGKNHAKKVRASSKTHRYDKKAAM